MNHLFSCFKALLFFIFFTFFVFPKAYALQVLHLDSSGTLELDNHQKIRFAGILMDAEAFKTVSVILSHKDIRLEEEKNLSDEANSDIHYYYVHVNALEMNLPFKPAESAKETSLMVNEVLVSLGLAKVDRDHEFKHKVHFQELEDQAREKGKGVWSYEPLARPKL